MILQVENISKKYLVNTQETKSILNLFNNSGKKEFWALNDVSFQINQGDRLGVIGNNGAGKSTLLKILSRISNPTSGNVTIKGKVASLLEVGTGFHPELTGRENIYLNGAILGMKKHEIDSNFEEIIDFAGEQIKNFLDTPVKRYSSGMYVRLGFAIAAHLNPDILIVDEVLAVGDIDFQKKSLGKMQEVSKKDRTILFVSHNITAVSNLCNKTLYLERGKTKAFGETGNILNNYLAEHQKNILIQEYTTINEAPGNDAIRLKYCKLEPKLFEDQEFLDIRNSFTLTFEFWNQLKNTTLNLSLHLYSATGECILNIATEPKLMNDGIITGNLEFPGNYLNDGNYMISLMVVKDQSIVLHNFENLITFDIADFRENAVWFGKWPGYVRPNFPFNFRQTTNLRLDA
ncbi:ATP-binding cassette domain-containing protein [Sandaracinomonas limnophila]|uniref:ATP-binding cassette domain-containing protein n=1 Tax=Sandaracinomonas limnophila TaxID=1862386 RepID=A0A437PWS0_9BACT|nr:polysaccharide ABC transporter ATP-binding protein [Sandaracinomonas limnophila]RVU26692.1 ATP-binding cassette domain-containing protein [Sandaracinomonas limnophila]